MSPKSGRFRPVDMSEKPINPPERFKPTDRRRILGALSGRFTLDEAQAKALKTGYASLDEVQGLLDYFVANGDIEKDGMMHWRKLKTVRT
jgi:phosphopantetheinyl transferase (holo-ACP synthase)